MITAIDWRDLAACRDADPDTAEAFFPAAAPGTAAYAAEAAPALAACSGCRVTAECLGHAVRTRQAEGIWGNTTPAEREGGRPALARGAA